MGKNFRLIPENLRCNESALLSRYGESKDV